MFAAYRKYTFTHTVIRSEMLRTELIGTFRKGSTEKSVRKWASLDEKLHKVLGNMTKKYPKGTLPHTFDPAFLADAKKLANEFLVTDNSDKGYVDFSRRLTICKENKDVNEVLLNYASSIAIFKRYFFSTANLILFHAHRTDMPHYVPNPTQSPKAMAVFRIEDIKDLP